MNERPVSASRNSSVNDQEWVLVVAYTPHFAHAVPVAHTDKLLLRNSASRSDLGGVIHDSTPLPWHCLLESSLEQIAKAYLLAYQQRNTALAPFASSVRYSENNVLMEFPDGSWDTVTRTEGEPLILSDPVLGTAAIFITVFHLDTPSFLAVRLGITEGQIHEVEHILSTRRNVSTPPEPFGNAHSFVRDPAMLAPVAPEERMSRDAMVRMANAYFSTLENNNGELRGGIRFTPDCVRHENGLKRGDVEADFRLGPYRANDRVRDRDFILVDERRSIVLARGFIDHKGALDTFTLTDGTPGRSIFREPHTWALLEAFKMRSGAISAIEAVFYGAPYYQRSPWTAPRA
ncbi:MAG: hypothetical protein PGN09_09295 [Sphingomonas fennica]